MGHRIAGLRTVRRREASRGAWMGWLLLGCTGRGPAVGSLGRGEPPEGQPEGTEGQRGGEQGDDGREGGHALDTPR